MGEGGDRGCMLKGGDIGEGGDWGCVLRGGDIGEVGELERELCCAPATDWGSLLGVPMVCPRCALRGISGGDCGGVRGCLMSGCDGGGGGDLPGDCAEDCGEETGGL